MPKIIFTSRYIKNPASSNAGKLIKYMGTREGVEKLPNGIDNSPATKKQNDLICTALKTVPEAWDYPEMKSYLENKTKSNATEFLNEFLERNADRIGGVKKLVSYYAERPGVEKLGKHGLFSQTDDKINLDEVAEEVSNHNGIVWTHVISLKREDAERLGYPYIGDKVVGDIKSAEIKKLLNDKMNEGYAYTTVKKVHNVLNEYFRYLTQQEYIDRNPMISAPMIKKSNFLAAQDKENLPTSETITVFTPEEIKIFKDEAFSTFSNGKRKYQQAAAYILMLNTGLRTGEVLGLINSDIDLENRVMHLNRGVKEISKRNGVTAEKGREVKVGKLKSATSKRDVPLNDTAIEMILDLRNELYFGEDSPLIPDENGNFTRPVNFRKRYYRILKAAGIETKGLHSLRHTFATNLVNGIKQPDGSIKSLTPRQVADLLGHTTSEITELYYVKRDLTKLNGITDGFDM